MKRLFSLTLAAVLLLCCFPLCAASADTDMKDSGLNYTESTEQLANPHMGYPAHASVTLKRSGNGIRNDTGFTWYYININSFSAGNARLTDNIEARRGFTPLEEDEPISEDALMALDASLENLRQNGGSCLIRFVYDWNGVPGCEPSSIEMIVRHIEQLCGVVAKYADICLGFECGIIGVFGEMHSSDYCGKEDADRVINAYLDHTPDSMILMVRTPTYIMNYLGLTREELAHTVTRKGSREYRLSYFNDGYMNTDNDTGTWGDRSLDLLFLASQSEHATYGGEYGSAFNYLPNKVCLPENAIPEMYQTHVNFIRGNVYKIGGKNSNFGYDQYVYSTEYEKDWYPDNSAFYNKNCYTFIVAHLGYRLVLRESKLSACAQAGGKLHLTGRIENTGFANILHEPDTQIILSSGGYAYTCQVSLDASALKSCTTQDYDMTLALPASLPAGEYQVYMRIAASTDTFYTSVKSGIQFANADTGNTPIYDATLGANHLGTVTVTAAQAKTSAASDVFCEIGSNCVAGGLVTAGAPALYGYGANVSGSLTLSYNLGDAIEIDLLNALRADAAATYTWYKNGVVISGANSSRLQIPSASASDAGAYRATIRSGADSYTTIAVTINITDHAFSDYITVTEPTCHSPGTAKRVNSDGSLSEIKYLPALAHTPQTVETPSTCTERGSVRQVCAACGDQLSIRLLDLLPHTYVDTVTQPTCTEDGETKSVCKDCGDTQIVQIPALGHDYVYHIDGNVVTGVCSRCDSTIDPLTYDGKITNNGVSAEDFDGHTEAVTITKDPLVLVGEGGFVTSYETGESISLITFLLRVSNVKQTLKLGKFRTRIYAIDNKNTPGDSNENGNYYGTLLYTVEEDGVFAFTITKRVMCNKGNGGFGKIEWAAFNDPDMTKGGDPVNENTDAKIELLGIYNGILTYNLLYTDENGKPIQHQSGDYNGAIAWSNLFTRVKSPEEVYQGQPPVKRADDEYIYTFIGWTAQDGQKPELALGNLILTPVYDKTENTCAHPQTQMEVIHEPTCTEPGLQGEVCVECGMQLSDEVIPATGHQHEDSYEIAPPSFRAQGSRQVYCTDCQTLLRVEPTAKLNNPFTDIDTNKWYSDAISYVTYKHIFEGVSAELFRPGTAVTRAMFVTVLGRLSGIENDLNAKTVFDDIPGGRYYTGYVAWANENGIVNGRAATRFAPDASITREEMCVMIARYCKYQSVRLGHSPDAVGTFADSSEFASWARDDINTCQMAGLINGKTQTADGKRNFVPDGNATRAEVATILYKLSIGYMNHVKTAA